MAVPFTPTPRTPDHIPQAPLQSTWHDADGVGWAIGYVLKFERFRNMLAGSLTCAWDAAYDKTRKTCTGVDNCWPAAMATCANAEDIQICLAFAQRNNLPVAIRIKPAPIDQQFAADGILILDISSCGEV